MCFLTRKNNQILRTLRNFYKLKIEVYRRAFVDEQSLLATIAISVSLIFFNTKNPNVKIKIEIWLLQHVSELGSYELELNDGFP